MKMVTLAPPVMLEPTVDAVDLMSNITIIRWRATSNGVSAIRALRAGGSA